MQIAPFSPAGQDEGPVFPVIALVLLLLCYVSFQARSQNYPSGFTQVQVAGGIANPTVMDFAPDGRIFVAEQTGKLKVIKNGVLLPRPFVDLEVNASGERGLIGIALDPDFSSNPYVYLYYTVDSRPVHNRVSRFRASGDVAAPGGEEVLLDMEPLSRATNHNGGAMHFGRDGKLYIAVGENAKADNAQNLNNHFGKILRINKDGSIPADNPFDNGNEARRRIWAYGLRNPYTFDIQPGTGKIFVNDVGNRTWEEINDATSGGRNFGWPDKEGRDGRGNYTDPVYTYRHGPGNYQGCAITGGAFFNPAATNYPAQYRGKYFFQDYCNGWINVMDVSGNERALFASNLPGDAVNLAVGRDGNLYFLSREKDALFKIVYNADDAPVITAQPAGVRVGQGQSASFGVSVTGTAPLSYQWQKNNRNIAGATGAAFTIDNVQPSDAGLYRVVVSNAAGRVVSNAARLTVDTYNSAPSAQINSPGNHAKYEAGNVITFSGTGSDPEDDDLPAGAYEWKVVFHHDTHTHPGPAVNVAADGRSGSFEIPNEGETAANVWYRLYLTVTDSKGLSATDWVDIDPKVVTVTLATSPGGLQLQWDGQPRATPLSVRAVAGMRIALNAPATQTLNGKTYEFDDWNRDDVTGGNILVPNTNVTYRATYRQESGGGGGDLRNPDNPANVTAGLNYRYYEGDWNQLPNFAALKPKRSGIASRFELERPYRKDRFGFQFAGYVRVPSDGQYTFYLNSDDGSELWIGSVRVVDNDGLHGEEMQQGTIGLKAGLHAITVNYFDKTQLEVLEVSYAGPGLSRREIPATALFYPENLRSPENPGNVTAGLNYSYYEGDWDVLPDFRTISPERRGTVSQFDLSPEHRKDRYAFQYRGYVQIPRDGEYTFYTSSDDGTQLFIGSTLVVDNDGLHSVEEQQGTIGLKAGLHAITVNYFEKAVFEVLEVSYAGLGLSKREIPATALFRSGGANQSGTSAVAGPTAETDLNAQGTVATYPNPVSDRITVQINAQREGTVELQLHDPMARSFSNTSHALQAGTNTLTVPVGHLPEGLYLLTIRQGGQRVVKQVAITH